MQIEKNKQKIDLNETKETKAEGRKLQKADLMFHKSKEKIFNKLGVQMLIKAARD